MKTSNLAIKIYKEEDHLPIQETEKIKKPWRLHRLVKIGPSIDIRCSNTLVTKERGKEGL